MNAVYWIKGPWSGRLAILARPRGGDWLEDDIQSWARSGIQVVVSLLTAEEATELGLADELDRSQSQGIEFVSFPIPDRGVPASRGDTLQLIKSLEELLLCGKTVGLHCRQGIGRSGLLAACLLVSSGVPVELAFSQLTEARGLPIPETDEQRTWVDTFTRQLVGAKPSATHSAGRLTSRWIRRRGS